jgi:hypothetical protein
VSATGTLWYVLIRWKYYSRGTERVTLRIRKVPGLNPCPETIMDKGFGAMNPLCTENPIPNSRYAFPFPQKKVYSPAGSVPPLSHPTSCARTKFNLHFAASPASVASQPALKRLLHFMCQISCQFSFAYVVRKNPSKS